MKAFIVKHIKLIRFLLTLILTILIGISLGLILVYQKGFSFPQIENLEDIQFKVMTVVHDDQGKIIREFAIEKRTIVRRSDIPEILVKAIVASEDNQFFTHWGINFKGTGRAILGVLIGKNFGGGSSITQQLALNHNLKREKTFFKKLKRKFKEMLMAIQIERRYSKDQILTSYCNTVPLASNIYGVAEAARFYFGKYINEINIAEAALIPSMFPSPNGIYNVFRNPDKCLIKRNHILKRMLNLGYISKTEYEEAIKVPLPKKPFDPNSTEFGDYFVEEIRKLVRSEFGTNQLYSGGLKIYTTLNSEMQTWAEDSLKKGLRALDKRQGWRGGLENLLGENSLDDLSTIELPSWENLEIQEEGIYQGVVLNVNHQRALIRIGNFRGVLNSVDAEWTEKSLPELLSTGDIALFKILSLPSSSLESELIQISLEQEPEVQGAILAMDNRTGAIKAMVGGYSFEKSEWNNATQALRQPGSVFKPIIYAAAIENGYTPATIVVDEPVVFDNEWTNKPYSPQNDSGEYLGPLTLRRALENSINLVSAKIVEDLTPPLVIEYARHFGITTPLKPYMSLALGATEVTLKEMVAAFSVFPNMGYRVNPSLIKSIIDQNDHVIKQGNYYNKKKVLEEESAFLLNYMLQGVIKRGTGRRAGFLLHKAPIGGKTGTTNNWTNAWFIGFSPSITVGVWVGHDTLRSLGVKEEGSLAALPIFIGFMEKYLEKYPEPKQFRKPSNILLVKIDRYTGKLFTSDCLYPFMEAFIRGSEPLEYCREVDHHKIMNYEGEEEQ
jgi:penicillin-binding protein 1A